MKSRVSDKVAIFIYTTAFLLVPTPQHDSFQYVNTSDTLNFLFCVNKAEKIPASDRNSTDLSVGSIILITTWRVVPLTNEVYDLYYFLYGNYALVTV